MQRRAIANTIEELNPGDKLARRRAAAISTTAADGRTRLDVPPAFIAGAGTASYVTHIEAAQAVTTIHFQPAGALPFLGIPMGELENSRVRPYRPLGR